MNGFPTDEELEERKRKQGPGRGVASDLLPSVEEAPAKPPEKPPEEKKTSPNAAS